MMVYAVRNFYNGTSGTELMGKKLGIHAYGNVGRNVARVAKGFGMEVYAYDAFCPKEVIEKDGVKALDSAAELYKTCQFVSLHIPATAESQFGNSIRVLSRSIHHTNVVSSSGSQVNIIISCTGTNHNLQLFRSIQHFCINNITRLHRLAQIFLNSVRI